MTCCPEYPINKLSYEPQEVIFTGPFKKNLQYEIQLTNPSDKHMTFKVKHTRVGRFAVQPVYGFITPLGGTKVINVTCRPFDKYLMSKRDRITIEIAETPFSGPDWQASHLWKRLTNCESPNIRRIVLPVIYRRISSPQIHKKKEKNANNSAKANSTTTAYESSTETSDSESQSV